MKIRKDKRREDLNFYCLLVWTFSALLWGIAEMNQRELNSSFSSFRVVRTCQIIENINKINQLTRLEIKGCPVTMGRVGKVSVTTREDHFTLTCSSVTQWVGLGWFT